MYLHTLSPPDSLPICFPVLSTGFEIETEISVHALELKMPVAEIDTPYFARIEGSESKLSTYGDGFRILRTIVSLYRIERPMLFFGAIGILFALAAVILAAPLAMTYIDRKSTRLNSRH